MLGFPPRKIPPLGPPRASARQRILAQWRGRDLVPDEKGRALHTRSAADCIPQVLSGLRIERRRAEAEIVKVWNNLLDPVIVAHAQPTGINKGTLFVSVDSSV